MLSSIFHAKDNSGVRNYMSTNTLLQLCSVNFFHLHKSLDRFSARSFKNFHTTYPCVYTLHTLLIRKYDHKKKIMKTHFANFKGSLCCISFCTLSNRLERRKKKIHLSTMKNGFFHLVTKSFSTEHLSITNKKNVFFFLSRFVITLFTLFTAAPPISQRIVRIILIKPDFLFYRLHNEMELKIEKWKTLL